MRRWLCKFCADTNYADKTHTFLCWFLGSSRPLIKSLPFPSFPVVSSVVTTLSSKQGLGLPSVFCILFWFEQQRNNWCPGFPWPSFLLVLVAWPLPINKQNKRLTSLAFTFHFFFWYFLLLLWPKIQSNWSNNQFFGGILQSLEVATRLQRRRSEQRTRHPFCFSAS